MKWFRLYNDLLNDPKVQRLPPKAFKALINLWCIASQNDGEIRDDEIAYKLRMYPGEAKEIVTLLVGAKLLERVGEVLVPWNWNQRQMRSDDSAAIKRAYRKTHPDKSKPRPILDTDTDTEQNPPIVPQGGQGANGVKKSQTHPECQIAVQNYNSAAEQLGLSKARLPLTGERERKLSARLKEHGLSGWNDALNALCEQPFCLGEGGRGWKATLDFLLQPGSLNKVLDRAYVGLEGGEDV